MRSWLHTWARTVAGAGGAGTHRDPIVTALRAVGAVVAWLVVCSQPAAAGGFAEGRVVGFIQGPEETRVSVYLDAPIADTPSCNQGATAFAFDIGTPQGRATYSALLAAMHAKTAVHAHGKGTCDVKAWEETLLWFVADPPLQ